MAGAISLGPVTTISGLDFFGLFERRMYLETFLRGGKRIRPGTFFYGQKTDVTSKKPWRPEILRKFKIAKSQNHLYHSKALEKRYRGLLNGYDRFPNLTREN